MRRNSNSNHIPILKWILCLLGFLGGYRKKKNIVSYFTMVSLIFILLLQGLDMTLNWTGIDTLKRLTFMPACFITLYKAFLMIMNSNELIDLISALKHFWRPDKFDYKTQKKIDKVFQFVTKMSRFYCICCFSLCTLITMLPWLYLEKRMMVLSDYAFCDTHGNFWCWLSMYSWQSFVLLGLEIPIACSFDVIFIICTGYIYNACQLLKTGLDRLNIDDRRVRHKILQQTVKQHDVVMNFVKSVDEMFTKFMLVQFWCSLWSLILILYMMVADGIPPKTENMLYYGALYITFAGQLFIYALGGAIIEEQLKSIPNAIFRVDWYAKGRTDLRKDLTFMILRAQNAKIMSVGKMSDLNLELFISTIKNSLSVFTLILQMDNSGANNEHSKR